MTKEALKQKFEELLQNEPLELTARAMFEVATESGAVNITTEPDDYRLPKIILHAILCEMADTYRPLDSRNRQEADNLKLFL